MHKITFVMVGVMYDILYRKFVTWAIQFILIHANTFLIFLTDTGKKLYNIL